MESMLKSLGAGSYSKAAPSSVVKLRELELQCAATVDNDDTASISADDGDCFGAFLDMMQIFSLEITVADDVDDTIMAPQLPPTLAGSRADHLSQSTWASTPGQPQSAPSDPFSNDQSTPRKKATMPSLISSGSNIESEALLEYPKAEALSEFPRLLHNDRGQRDRRQRRSRINLWKVSIDKASNSGYIIESEALPEYSKVEALPEFPRRLHNDRGQRDRRRRQKWGVVKAESLRKLQATHHRKEFLLGDRRQQVGDGERQVSSDEEVVANDLNTKVVSAKAPRNEILIVAE